MTWTLIVLIIALGIAAALAIAVIGLRAKIEEFEWRLRKLEDANERR